jgi:broad specificity phosphatase PhoE
MLILVRHGVTSLNEQQRVQGSLDKSLSRQGRHQVGLLEKWLSGLNLNIRNIHTSPAQRAVETADILAKGKSIDLIVMDDLRERDFGPFEGMNRQEIIKARGLTESAYKDVVENWEGLDGVEQSDTIAKRALAVLRQCGTLSSSSSQDYLVCTHAGVIEAVLIHLLPVIPQGHPWIKIPPASSVGLGIERYGNRLLHLWPNPATRR